jgi:hypothetical protein
MKSKVLVGIVGTFIICVAIFNVIISMTSGNKFGGNFDLKQLESFTGDESGEQSSTPRYRKVKDKCTKTFNVDVDGYIFIFGKRRYVGGVSGTYTTTYENVQIDCPVGTTFYTCKECSCSNFWSSNC